MLITKKAFTLIELMIYVVLFSFVSLLIFGFLRYCNTVLVQTTKRNEQIIRTSLVYDILKRDLLCASCNAIDWDMDNMVFKKTGQARDGKAVYACVGWQFRKDGVFRIQGEYDFIQKKWKKRKSSRAGFAAMPLVLEPVLAKNGKTVEAVTVKQGEKVELMITLRNRVLS